MIWVGDDMSEHMLEEIHGGVVRLSNYIAVGAVKRPLPVNYAQCQVIYTYSQHLL